VGRRLSSYSRSGRGLRRSRNLRQQLSAQLAEVQGTLDRPAVAAVTCGQQEGDDFLFFGLVDGFEKELGYFSLSELKSGPWTNGAADRTRPVLETPSHYAR